MAQWSGYGITAVRLCWIRRGHQRRVTQAPMCDNQYIREKKKHRPPHKTCSLHSECTVRRWNIVCGGRAHLLSDTNNVRRKCEHTRTHTHIHDVKSKSQSFVQAHIWYSYRIFLATRSRSLTMHVMKQMCVNINLKVEKNTFLFTQYIVIFRIKSSW